MPKFSKKPVVIEAEQLIWENWSTICDFAGVGKLEDGKPTGTDKDPRTGDPIPDGGPGLLIPSKVGLLVALPGDWIIRDVAGEFDACKPDIFEQTYEVVEE